MLQALAKQHGVPIETVMTQFQMMQKMMGAAAAASGAQPPMFNAGRNSGGSGDANEQDAAVFDAVFAAQQAQQMQFVYSVKHQDGTAKQLIGSPTGPLLECRFTD